MTTALLDNQGSVPPALLIAADAHLARRFYQRPEEDTAYRAGPDPDFVPPPVTQPPPDFHRRASLLGDLSPLLRRLGLIVDLRVDDLAALAGLTDLSADIVVPGLTNQVGGQPRVACEVAGRSFTATSASGDYVRGMLQLGDGESFTVLDLDPDASALKLEQYVRTLPRLLATETNGDATTSAPSTLQANGFALARNDRADRLRSQLTGAPAKDAALVAGTAAPLNLEDVARGVRLEVWDDVSTAWRSLHRRRLTAEVEGAGTVLDAAPDTGFLQGASLTSADGVADAPVHAHEVLAGWDGWSLSAPRPGLVAVHDGGTEHLVQPAVPAPDAEHPVQTGTAVEPGTLPRLRYGRNYAFRAWAVDLAGNSAPHTVAGPPEAGAGGVAGAPAAQPDPPTVTAATSIAQGVHARLPVDAAALPGRAAQLGAATITFLRGELTAQRTPPVAGPQRGSGALGAAGTLAGLRLTKMPEVDALVATRLAAQQAAPTVAAGPSRRLALERVVDDALPNLAAVVERTEAQVRPAALATALSSAALSQPGLSAADIAALLGLLQKSVTAPRPFLRWDPVLEPVVMPRHEYSAAESLLTLVIRSDVEGPAADGVTMTVVPPETYVPATLAAHPDLDLAWRTDSQRHLVPPKTTQLECELHGLFDAAFGGGTPADLKAALGDRPARGRHPHRHHDRRSGHPGRADPATRSPPGHRPDRRTAGDHGPGGPRARRRAGPRAVRRARRRHRPRPLPRRPPGCRRLLRLSRRRPRHRRSRACSAPKAPPFRTLVYGRIRCRGGSSWAAAPRSGRTPRTAWSRCSCRRVSSCAHSSAARWTRASWTCSACGGHCLRCCGRTRCSPPPPRRDGSGG